MKSDKQTYEKRQTNIRKETNKHTKRVKQTYEKRRTNIRKKRQANLRKETTRLKTDSPTDKPTKRDK